MDRMNLQCILSWRDRVCRIVFVICLFYTNGEAQITTVGGEMNVNTTVTNRQEHPAAAMDSSGNYVVVWATNDVSNPNGIYGQRYAKDGSTIGSEFVISNPPGLFPDVAMAEDGRFVVVWQRHGGSGQEWNTYGKYFTATGVGGTEFALNTNLPGIQRLPAVGMDSMGGFVAVWEDQQNIIAQRFAANTSPIGTPITIDTSMTGFQSYPDVAVLPNGNFNVVWQSENQDASLSGIYGRQMLSNGTPKGDEFRINTNTTGNQVSPRIAVDQDGLFVVTWVSDEQDGDEEGIFMQLFDSSGVVIGVENQVNTTTIGAQDNPDVNRHDNGQFMITWNSYSQDGSFFGVYYQFFNKSGQKLFNETLVNTTTAGFQQFPVVSMRSKDNIVVAWQDGMRNSNMTLDGDDYGIALQNMTIICTYTCPDTILAGYSNLCNFVMPDFTSLLTLDTNCLPPITVTQDPPPNVVILGDTVITFSVQDASGVPTSCLVPLILIDSTAPTIVCQDITVYLDGAGNATITAADIDGGSTDNCGINSMSASLSSFTCANIGANNVTLTVTDGGNNSSNCVAVVTVSDSTRPVAVCQNITVYLDGAGNASVTTADIDGGSSDNCGSPALSASQTAFTCADLGPNNVMLTATDGSSNTDNCGVIVTVVDTTSPNAVCQNINVYLDGSGNATIVAADIDGGSTDNCGAPTLSASQTAFTCANSGPNNVTLTATDGSSNTGNCVAVVTVIDSTAPTAVCQDITVYLDGAGNATITAADIDGGSTDNCGINNISASQTSFTCADIGPNNVTLTATDGNSNTDNCVAVVTVSDSTRPTAVCQNITVYMDGAGNASITAADIDGGSTDNCSVSNLSASQTSFTCANLGPNNVTLTVTDGSSNTGICQSIVTVTDTTSPIALCNDITVYLDMAGNASITPGDIDNGSNDNCGVDSIWLSHYAFLCSDTGVNVVILTVRDSSGNSSTCNSLVTVRDTIPPAIICKPAYTLYIDTSRSTPTISASDLLQFAFDTCGIASMSLSRSVFDCDDLGTYLDTVTVVDVNGNVSTCITAVQIEDPLNICCDIPDIICPNDTIIVAAPFACDAIVNFSTPTIISNCIPIITQISGLPSGSVFPFGTTENTYVATNGPGKSDTCSFTVTVLENGQPNPLTQHILRSSAGLVCQDKVHVSLGADCQRLITARDLLPLQSAGCIDRYRVSLNIQRGTSSDPIPNNTVNETHRGHEITFMVEDMETGNRCWGTLLVEEKYPPQIICRNDTISCLHMGERADLVITSDNCSDIKPQIDVLEKVWTDLGCEDREFIGYLSRKVRATDLWGNYNECRDTLWVWKEVLDSLICPEDTALACNLQHGNVDVLWKTGANGYTYLDAEGYAHPWPTDARGIAPAPYLKSIDPDQADGYMIPMKTDSGPVFDNGGKCHIVFKYKDHVIPTCGKAYKIRREWIISDWCAKRDTTCIQWIKITDELPPVIDTRYFVPDNDPDLGPWLIEDHDLKATVDAHDCKAHVALEDIRNLVERRTGIAHPDGGWAKECDDDLKLYYELEYADPTHPGKKVVIQENYDDKQYLYLPAGYYVITWRLQDQCWNESRVRQKVWVFDETPPVPVCDEITQVTLDPEACWARIDAIDLDDGSHDNCCDRLHFAVAQMDSINHWRKYWTDYFIGCLDPYDYQHYHSEIEQAIEEWINIFVFDDYVDLTECGEENLVLRVYEACDMPPYDPHVFYGGKHEWYWWNLSDKFAGWYYWRLNEYLHYGDPRASFSCDLITAALPVAANGDGGFSPVQWDYPVDPLHCPTPITEAHGGKKSPICKYLFESSSAENEWKQRVQLPYPSEVSILEGLSEKKRYEFPHLYSDCMIEVIKDDKTPPVCKAPADVTYYCDGVPYHWIIPVGVDQVQGWGASYAHDVCYESDVIRANCELDKTPVQVWDVRNGGTDKLSKLNGTIANPARWCVAVPWNGGEHGYYGGPTDGYYTEDCDSKPWGVTGMVYDYDWKPIYCRVWLLLDQYDLGDASGKPDPKSYFGEVEYSDNCWVDEPTYEDSGSLNECGVGVLTRTWTVKDKCENQSVCYQLVVIKPRSDFEVVFPPDVEVNCNELEGLDPDIAGRPIVSDDDCELIGINYVDERFTITADGCYKILRTWTLIDWCVYDPDQHFRHPDVIVDDRVLAGEDRGCVYRHLKDDGDGYMIYLQVIKVVDEEAPEVTCTTPQVICNYDEDCEPEVLELDFGSATDNCALANEIAYRYIIKVGQSEDSGDWLYGHGNTHTGALPFGIHDVYLIATDRCGNEDTCTTQVAINDCKRPTPYCYDGVATVVMPSSQSVEVWAKDLDAGSFDNCTEKDNLYFSFDAFGLESSRVFTCADIPDGKMEQIEVEIYVWDEAGNVDKCVTYILLQDGSGDVCEDQIIAANPGAKEMGLSMSGQGKVQKNNAGQGSLDIRENNGHAELFQNRPNPFRNETEIGFYLPKSQQVVIRIYNVNGQTVARHEGNYATGNHTWRYRNTQGRAGTGLLYYQLQTDSRIITRKMVRVE